MAVILENRRVEEGWYELSLSGVPGGAPGQFLMLRAPGVLDPLLGRPISIFDFDAREGATKLLYQVVGHGTQLFSTLKPDQEIDVTGPHGNGFPLPENDAVLIGGGVGIAPMYLLAKELREREPQRRITIHLGFRERPVLEETFAEIADEIIVNVGGYVTDGVDFSQSATYFACGPTPMMEAAARLARRTGARLYVSLEKRMACGVGACYACTCATRSGNKRACKDGPVFPAQEVFYE
ncbi:MAG: dihydroorotate dehydrogenase electron transfer subunit [Bacillota bacterium]